MGVKGKITRREFLSRTATAVGAGICSPYILTSEALGGPGQPPASDRIISGHIGVGGRGGGFLRKDGVAVCDVDESHRVRAAKIIASKGGKADGYVDYRKVLDHNDIDVVFIASPDHWHGLHTVHA
ncbi:twin-arginine translocation signal domain-containing protein, partial [bacterium]|nr:twin-arginine translocation signal domain-containing protein [bacterium]